MRVGLQELERCDQGGCSDSGAVREDYIPNLVEAAGSEGWADTMLHPERTGNIYLSVVLGIEPFNSG